MQKNSGIGKIIIMLALLLAPLLLPYAAEAYMLNRPPVLGTANVDSGTQSVCPGSGLTSRMILCVRDTIIFATAIFLVPFSQYLAHVIAIACTLAVVIWGVKVMTTARTITITRDGMILGLKISIVLIMTTNFGGYFPMFLDLIESLLNVIAQPAARLISYQGCQILPHMPSEANILAVWDVVDCYIDRLIGGIYSPFTLVFSITGFLLGALLSSSIGLFIALMGFYMIALILFAIARALYIFVTAYIAFALMVIISPIFIPLILFQYTKGIFEKWLKITIGFLLQPIFLFGFLVMFLIAYDAAFYSGKYSLYYAIAGEASQTTDAATGAMRFKTGFKIGEWIQQNNGYKPDSIGDSAMNVDPARADGTSTAVKPTAVNTGAMDIQGNVARTEQQWESGVLDSLGVGNLKTSFFKTDIPVNALDWERMAELSGAGDVQRYKIRVFLAFVMALVMIYIFYNMIEYLPFIGSGIAGEGTSTPALGTGKLAPMGSKVFGGGGGGGK